MVGHLVASNSEKPVGLKGQTEEMPSDGYREGFNH